MPGISDHTMLRELPDAAIQALVLAAGEDSGSPLVVDVRQLGGALGRAPAGAGALSHLALVTDALAPWDAGNRYLNFVDRPGDPARFFKPRAYQRLREIKAAYDPAELFRANHPIAPSSRLNGIEPTNQPTTKTGGSAHDPQAPFITLALLALLVPAGNASAFSDGQRHGCGVLVDAAHPWRSHVPGGNVETGDHWITDRLGTHGSCAFTRAAIKKLLALAPRTYQQRDAGHLAGGLCDWSLGSGHEAVRPFQHITCHLPIHLRHHHTYLTTVEAFVDPDPQFIHVGR